MGLFSRDFSNIFRGYFAESTIDSSTFLLFSDKVE